MIFQLSKIVLQIMNNLCMLAQLVTLFLSANGNN